MEKYEAATLSGFVQKLVTGYMVHGYYFYVTGRIPDRVPDSELEAVDRRLAHRYGCDKSYRTRVRRRQAGLANCYYLRYRRDWVLVATHGLGSKRGDPHPFFGEHLNSVSVKLADGRTVLRKQVRDFREDALRFHGYSISLRWEGVRPKGPDGRKLPPDRTTKRRGSVRIDPDEYRALKSFFAGIAPHRSVGELSELLGAIPFEPYAPIRVQLLSILKSVNEVRRAAGYEEVPREALRLKRRSAALTGGSEADKGDARRAEEKSEEAA